MKYFILVALIVSNLTFAMDEDRIELTTTRITVSPEARSILDSTCELLHANLIKVDGCKNQKSTLKNIVERRDFVQHLITVDNGVVDLILIQFANKSPDDAVRESFGVRREIELLTNSLF